MKTKEQINERIHHYIEKRGDVGREIDRLKEIKEPLLWQENELINQRSLFAHLTSLMNALEWVVDDVRYPYRPIEKD